MAERIAWSRIEFSFFEYGIFLLTSEEMMRAFLMFFLISLAVVFVSCKDNSDTALIPSADEGAALSGAGLNAQERDEIIKASPDYGKWVYHKDLDAYIAFRKANRLDEAMGDGIVKKLVDQIEKKRIEVERVAVGITQEEYVEKKAKYEHFLEEALARGEINQEEMAEYADAIDLMLKKFLGFPKKMKQNNTSLAWASQDPDPIDGVRITLTTTRDIARSYGPTVNSTFKLLYNRPSAYTDRRLHSFRLEWSVPTQETSFNGAASGTIVVANLGCWVPDSSWTPFLPGLFSSTGTGQTGRTGYYDFGDPPLNECFIASSQWYFDGDFVFDVDTNGQGGWTLESTAIDFSDLSQSGNFYRMGGKCDAIGDQMYTTHDIDKITELWHDFSQATTYEHWSADYNDSGDLNVADIMQCVYVIVAPSITCHNSLFDPWNQ